MCSAQNNCLKLVNHLFKEGTSLQTIIGFSIENVQQNMSYQIGLAQSHTKVGQKMTRDRPLF